MSNRPRKRPAFDHALTLYLEDTIRIERRHRTKFYGKLMFAMTAALMLMQAPHDQSFAGKVQTQAFDAVAGNQAPENWTRLAFVGPQFR